MAGIVVFLKWILLPDTGEEYQRQLQQDQHRQQYTQDPRVTSSHFSREQNGITQQKTRSFADPNPEP
jgi:hypothetical protein